MAPKRPRGELEKEEQISRKTLANLGSKTRECDKQEMLRKGSIAVETS